MESNITDQSDECFYKLSEQTTFFYISLGPAILIMVVLAVVKRGNRFPGDVCKGRPSIVVPVNLLDEYTNRWSYAVVFGAITNTILTILTGTNGNPGQAELLPALKILLKFWWALQASVNYFPFFACLYTDNVLLGAIIGATYSSVWLIYKIVALVGCMDPVPEILPYVILLEQWPTLVCLGFMVLRFIFSGFTYMRGEQINQSLQKIEDSVAFHFQIDYVEALLKKARVQSVNLQTSAYISRLYNLNDYSVIGNIRTYFKTNFYDSECHFKFSSRIICIFMIILMMIYQICVFALFMGKLFKKLAKDLINEALNPGIQKIFGETLIQSWDISVLLAFTLFAIGMIGTLSNYRTNLLALHRGDRSFCPPHYNMETSKKVASSMRYAGYQIAFTIGASLLTILASFFIIWIFYIIFKVNETAVVNWLLQYMIFLLHMEQSLPLFITIAIRFVQRLLAKNYFLQPSLSQPPIGSTSVQLSIVMARIFDKCIPHCMARRRLYDPKMDQPLALRNRPWYHVVDYFFFLANVSVGLFSCVLRILTGAFVGLFYLGRLDKCIFMPGWETSDRGFMAYMGMLEMEHAHNHPVLRVFCHLLVQKQPDVELSAPQDGGRMSARRPIARRRWHLLYTLIRNPQLIQERRLARAESSSETTCRFIPVGRSITFDRLKATVNTMEMIGESKRFHTNQPAALNEENINFSINNSFA